MPGRQWDGFPKNPAEIFYEISYFANVKCNYYKVEYSRSDIYLYYIAISNNKISTTVLLQLERSVYLSIVLGGQWTNNWN